MNKWGLVKTGLLLLAWSTFVAVVIADSAFEGFIVGYLGGPFVALVAMWRGWLSDS